MFSLTMTKSCSDLFTGCNAGLPWYINKAKSRWNFALKGKGIYMKWYLVNIFEPNKIEFISCMFIKTYVGKFTLWLTNTFFFPFV